LQQPVALVYKQKLRRSKEFPMRQFLTIVSVVVLGLAVADTARADVIVRVRRPVAVRPVVVTNPPVRTQFAGGWYYQGINQRHWTYTYWSTRYRTALYWDPYVATYYYWYAPARRYYPVSYIQAAPPVVSPGLLPPAGIPMVESVPPPPPALLPSVP
jgi:hypothetical protein